MTFDKTAKRGYRRISADRESRSRTGGPARTAASAPLGMALVVLVGCGSLFAQQPAPAPVAPTTPAAPAPVAQAQAPTTAPTASATVAAPAAAPVPDPNENWLTGSLDLGYRWVTGVGGSFDTYRSIVDLGSGPKLLGADFTIVDPKHRLFDRLDVRAYDWGDDPYSSVHVDLKKAKLYEFSADYRNIAYYNNLPSFADPLLGTTGTVLNEQSLDTRQRFSNFQLELLPWSRIVPYLAYERDASSGTGVATFVSDGDEFPVVNLVRNSTSNYRGGVRVEFSRLHLVLEEGGTTYTDNDQLNQNTGSVNGGNFTTPLLGQTLDLTGLSETYGIRGHSIYSKGLLTANVTSWLDISGHFLFSQPDSTVNFLESSAGNQVVLNQVLFYMGEQTLISAESKLPHTSAGLGGEIRPFRRLRILPSWMTDRIHSSGASASQQNLVTTTGPVALDNLLSSALATNYNQAEITAVFDLTSKITIRAGYRYVWGDATDVIFPISELAGFEQGKIRRNVALAGVVWRPLKTLTINGDFEDGVSGSTYFQTSLYDYQKARIRGRYQASKSLSISASASVLNNRNPASANNTGINYAFLARQESVSFFYMPAGGKFWDIQGGYTRSTLKSDIGYLDPEFLIPVTSLYRDNSHTATAMFDANIPVYGGVKAKLSFGGSLFISSGSNPTKFYQPVGKLTVPFRKEAGWGTSWVTEWRYYGFDEAFYLYQGFRAQMVTTGFRFTR